MTVITIQWPYEWHISKAQIDMNFITCLRICDYHMLYVLRTFQQVVLTVCSVNLTGEWARSDAYGGIKIHDTLNWGT